MKSIVRITQRLVSLFLVLVASSMMFLSSPAIAATSSATTLSLVNITDENYQTEVIQSSKSKPVIVIVAPKISYSSEYLEKLKTEAKKFYGDKYKILTGKTEENKGFLTTTLAR